jgi:hypothetical protein
MASTQVVVRVLDGTSVVDESIRRPVRLTPDGFAGVVYAGAVFPLLSDNTVDIAGPSWEIEDCNRFLWAGAPIPYAPRPGEAPSARGFSGFGGEWNVETSRLGHYVVFNASERIATGVVDALENGGLAVQRWDVSHRPASNGRFYDWFARLRFKGTHEECVAHVSAILAQTVSDITAQVSPALSATRLEELETHVEQLLDQVVGLRARLAASEREGAELRESLVGTTAREAKLSADLDRALDHQKSLHEQLDALRDFPEYSPGTSALLAQQSETEELLELALAENAELRRHFAYLRQQTDQGAGRIRTLETTVLGLQERLEEIGEQERERRRSAMARLAPRRGVPGFLDSAFARLAFVLDSVEVLANLEAPSSALRCLVQIDMGELVGKDLEGMRGWREVSKLATGIAGSEDMGRIYYKPDGERVLVSVHVKHDDKEQRRHIERLRTI